MASRSGCGDTLAKCHCPETLPVGRPTSPRGVEVVEMNGPQRLYSTVQKSKPGPRPLLSGTGSAWPDHQTRLCRT